MSPMISLFLRLGRGFHPAAIVALIVLFNATWIPTLGAFGHQFEAVSGYQPIDLQNVSGILTAEEALAQIATYSTEARSLYWSFFILDNIVPLLSFGAFSLLWAAMLPRLRHPFFQNLLTGPFLLLPWGVGLFDILENLCFILCISGYAGDAASATMTLGLWFVLLKALCLSATFMTTLVLLASLIVVQIRGFWLRVAQPA